MSTAYEIGAHHAAWAIAYLAGVLTIVALVALAIGAGHLIQQALGRLAIRHLIPRLDILRNRN